MVERTRERARPAPARNHVNLGVSVVRNAAALSWERRVAGVCHAIGQQTLPIHDSTLRCGALAHSL